MEAIPGNATITRRDSVFATDLNEDETVMLQIDRGMYFGVKDVGKVIWSELERPTTVDQLCRELMKQYDVDGETCRREVSEFISYLLQQRLIDVRTDDAPA